MSAASLNLLSYPRRMPHTSVPVRWALAGILLGLLTGVGRGLWTQAQLPVWQQQRQQWQAHHEQEKKAASQASARWQQVRQQQQAQARHAEWQERRQQLLRLHELLTQAAADAGLRLQRWQGDEQRIQLHGSLSQPGDWAPLQQRLTAASPQAWRLQNLLSSGGAAGIELVLEMPWHAGKVPAGGSGP